jgi:hypothetical protein
MRPWAGLAMASRSVIVIRGIKAPLLLDLTSIIAELSGAEPSALIPTFWEKLIIQDPRRKRTERRKVFMVYLLYFFDKLRHY